MQRSLQLTLLALICAIPVSLPAAEAARYPDAAVNGIEWFYVFGEQGNEYYGAEKEKKLFFVEVPQGVESVTVTVIDADCQGKHDEMATGAWNTGTKFSVYGGAQLLGSESVTHKTKDGTTLRLGPFAASQGDNRGGWTVFRIEVEGLDGNDNNLFAFEIDPSQAQFYAFNPAIRLADEEGARMRFFPAVPPGTQTLRAWNYDLDPPGGTGVMLPPDTSKMLRVKNSGSAEWASTDLVVPPEWSNNLRWTYQVTKGTQVRGNMSMRFEDDRGQLLPIYFTPGEVRQVARPPAPKPAPLVTCNSFEFDASKSYDPDNQQLTYAWDFGDGTTGDQIQMRHTYSKPGEYQVVLTVTDNSTAECRTSQTRQWLSVNSAPDAILDAPQTACVGSTVHLSAGKSTDASGDKLAYRWDLGDGTTAEGSEVTHTYAKGGTYQVRVNVDDQRQTTCSNDLASAAIRVNAPPIARANDEIIKCNANPLEPLEVTFDAASSADADGGRLAYRWDFGDGSTGEGARVSHIYQKGGRYTAQLIVDDGSQTPCAMATASVPVRLNRAPTIAAIQDVLTCAGGTIAFDASGSIDPDGDPVTYAWDFGDGTTAQGAKVSHAYAQGGTYRVKVAADDGSGMSCAITTASLTARINSAPRAVAKADELGCTGRSIAFDASNSNDPDGQRLTYAWDFGDGTTAQGAKIDHAYQKGGRYPITLTVSDESGTQCSVAVARGEVRINTPPVANTGPNLVCCVQDANTFDASKSSDADGDQLTYRWDFGDGSTGEGVLVQHSFQKFGQFPVRVTVNDNTGIECGQSTASFVANVNAAPVAQMAIRGEGGKIISATAGETPQQQSAP